MKRRCSIVLGLLAALSAAPLSAAVVTQTAGYYDISFFNAGDADDVSTGTQDWSAEQIAAVVDGVDAWATKISNAAARQVVVHMFWNDFDGLTLGSANNTIWVDEANAWTGTELVWRENYNAALAAGECDLRIRFDADAAGSSWNFATDAPNSLQIDFRSVVAHEIGHSLGITTLYNSTTDMFDSVGLTAWEKNLRDAEGNAPDLGTTGTPGDFNQTDNPVYFVGDNAVALYGGNVPVYAPTTFRAGSSLSHVDESFFSSDLMSPSIGAGQMVREPSELDWAIMRDLGWSIVPEPSTVAMLAGIVLAGAWITCNARRRAANLPPAEEPYFTTSSAD